MTPEHLHRWCNHTRIISGNTHYLVERHDGVRFYLDQIFRFALDNYGGGEALNQELIKMGVKPEEVLEIFKILQLAGLVEACGDDE